MPGTGRAIIRRDTIPINKHMKKHLKRIIISAILVFALSCSIALAEDEETMQVQAPAEPVSFELSENTEAPPVTDEPRAIPDDQLPSSEEQAVLPYSEAPESTGEDLSDATGEDLQTDDTDTAEPVTVVPETPASATPADEPAAEEPSAPAQGEESGSGDDPQSGGEPGTGSDPQSGEKPEPVVYEAKIVKRDNSLYYIDPKTGEIRTEAGFITYNGKRYYITKGGRIAVSTTVTLERGRYHAGSKGAILTGVHKWNGMRYYSGTKSGKLKSVRGFVIYNGRKYHVYPSGRIAVSKLFIFNDRKYIAGSTGVILRGVHKWNNHYYYSSVKNGIIRVSQGLVKWNRKYYFVQKGGRIRVNQPFFYKNKPYVSSSTGRCRLLTSIDTGPVTKVARKQDGIMTGVQYWQWYYGTRFVDTDLTPWCGAFVAWCFNAAGQYSRVSGIRAYGNLGYVPSYSRYASANGRWINRSTAKGGDIIVFGSDMHVGIVEYVCNGYVYTIEGNAGPTAAVGCGKPGAVIRRLLKLDDPRIKGILHV